jgi:hypothetical protein
MRIVRLTALCPPALCPPVRFPPVLRTIALSTLLGAMSTGCANDAMDASCTPDSPSIDLDDDCIYVNGQVAITPKPCEPYDGELPAAPPWEDVFSLLNSAQQGNCSADYCHGVQDTAADGIWLPAGNRDTFYEALTNAKGSIGRPYLAPDNPAASWMHCNVRGAPGGGSAMPKPAGMPILSDALRVEAWVLAGAPK